MCGIGGFFAQRPVPAAVADAMQRALRPRGPDARAHRGLCSTTACCTRACRSSTRGRRPTSRWRTTRGDIWIVYNGEVYDWQADAAALRAAGAVFRTRSDTEFILRGYEAWGIERLLERLRGMFAFAIVDCAGGKGLHRARPDGREAARLRCVDGELAFGSTVRAVLPFLPAAQRGSLAEAIDAYLAHRYVPAPRTIFGTSRGWRTATTSSSTSQAGGSRSTATGGRRRKPGRWLEALRRSGAHAHRRRPAARHVPLGRRRLERARVPPRGAGLTQYRTFTAAFPGSDMDESAAARDTAPALGLPNHAIVVPHTLADDFARIVAALDEPFADPSQLPDVVSRARR